MISIKNRIYDKIDRLLYYEIDTPVYDNLRDKMPILNDAYYNRTTGRIYKGMSDEMYNQIDEQIFKNIYETTI